jgi:ABC-type iron transport system FetAB permease component
LNDHTQLNALVSTTLITQYWIEICSQGMLLGNCINGVSLSLNFFLTSLVESSREVELFLSFGASSYEASARLTREAVRTGAMPQLNSMAVIGIISIPGMMTGELLTACWFWILHQIMPTFCLVSPLILIVYRSDTWRK